MQSVLSFYQQVFEQELSHARKLHLNASRIVQHAFISEKEELINGEHPYIPILPEEAEKLLKTMQLRAGELELVYFSLIRISRFVAPNKQESKRLYPLFSYPAKIYPSGEGHFFLELDTATRNVYRSNFPSALTGNYAFEDLLINPYIDVHFVMRLHGLIQQCTPEASSDALSDFPKLWSKRKLNARTKKVAETDYYAPIGILALVEKEQNSLDSLSELKRLAESQEFSTPLQVLFNNYPNASEEKSGILCEELNHSQLTAITNSNRYHVSSISGPPGTGKSYTIANLAAEKVSKGQSVLITAKNREALDVVEEKIQHQIGIPNLCVNPSKDASLKWMVRHLEYILGRQFKQKKYNFNQIKKAFNSFEKKQKTHTATEQDLLNEFEKEKHVYDSLNTKRFTAGKSRAFKQKILTLRSYQQNKVLWERLESYYKELKALRKTGRETLQMTTQFMLENGINNYRRQLRHYQAFLKARGLDRKRKLLKQVEYKAVLTAFPVWLVRANDISKVLPLEHEIFDVLIIDEASQCDIPSLLPLIQRAKKLIVVGDNKQLRHISFVPTAFEDSCRMNVSFEQKHLCRHRNFSVLDLLDEAIDPHASVRLNEHFRSQFPIIAFSNNHFYEEDLDILTKRPVLTADHVQTIRIDGERAAKGHNESEANAILAKIAAIITAEQELPQRLKTSIGVLSPFRGQVDYIFDQLVRQFPYQSLNKHKIAVGTAYTFQGGERDLMLLSLALDDQSHGGSFNYLNRKDVFNVSVTRARSQQIVYHSFSPDRLNISSTVAHFFRFYGEELKDDQGRSTKDEFCTEVAAIVHGFGLSTWTNFTISGISIDLLIRKGDDFFGIDLIGFPGEMEGYYSLERYKMIERGQIRLFPLPYPLWEGDRQKCVDAIVELLEVEPGKPNPTSKGSEEKVKRNDSATDFEIKKTFDVEQQKLVIELVQNATYAGNLVVYLEKTIPRRNLRDQCLIELNIDQTTHYLKKSRYLMDAFFDWLSERPDIRIVFSMYAPSDSVMKKVLENYGFQTDLSNQANLNFNRPPENKHNVIFYRDKLKI